MKGVLICMIGLCNPHHVRGIYIHLMDIGIGGGMMGEKSWWMGRRGVVLVLKNRIGMLGG